MASDNKRTTTLHEPLSIWNTWTYNPRQLLEDDKWDDFVSLTKLPYFRINGCRLVGTTNMGSVVRCGSNMGYLVRCGSLRHVRHAVEELGANLFLPETDRFDSGLFRGRYRDVVHYAKELWKGHRRDLIELTRVEVPPERRVSVLLERKQRIEIKIGMRDRAERVYEYLCKRQAIEQVLALACADIEPNSQSKDCAAASSLFGDRLLFDRNLVKSIFQFL